MLFDIDANWVDLKLSQSDTIKSNNPNYLEKKTAVLLNHTQSCEIQPLQGNSIIHEEIFE